LELDAAVNAVGARGRVAWPGLDVPRDALVRFLSARPLSWEHAEVRASDLYLACACVERIPGADTAYLDAFLPRLPQWLGRFGSRPELIDEVRQILAVRVLVGDGEHPPAIAEYAGRGSLEGWARTIATREVLAIVRREGRGAERPQEGLAQELLSLDEEIGRLKRMYRAPVLAAFEAGCRTLAPGHRALLRLHYVHGLTGASLATMYGISRATLNRRLLDAREALVQGVSAELSRATGMAAEDVESVLRLVRSQVDLRLSLLLAETAAAEAR
jgi:RNA polymerase sigma-70 factor (ECF subfamily)